MANHPPGTMHDRHSTVVDINTSTVMREEAPAKEAALIKVNKELVDARYQVEHLEALALEAAIEFAAATRQAELLAAGTARPPESPGASSEGTATATRHEASAA
eukprot:7950829-Lingulodinium_polyedra.AAC.1